MSVTTTKSRLCDIRVCYSHDYILHSHFSPLSLSAIFIARLKKLKKILLRDLYELLLDFTECSFKNVPVVFKVISLININSGLSIVRASILMDWNNFVQLHTHEVVEVCAKILYQVELQRTTLEQMWGFSVEAELIENAERQDELCCYVSRVEDKSLGMQNGT